MKRLRYLALFLAGGLLLGAPSVQAQSHETHNVSQIIGEGKQLLEHGLNRNDQAQIKKARALFERATSAPERAALAHYYAALADYRLATLTDEKDPSVQYLDDAVKHLKQAIEQQPNFAEAHALLSGAYGMKAGLQPLRAMFFGPKSSSAMGRAQELAPKNPRAELIKAIGTLNKPSLFGGGIDKALPEFRQAIQLFEQAEAPADSLQPTWGHAEAYAWLGIAHAKEDRFKSAREAFEQALEINPEYGWVKYELMPRLEESVSEQ